MTRIVTASLEHWAAVQPLIAAHWAEVGFAFPCQPDRGRYAQALADGVLVALVALEGETAVGYSTAWLSPHHFNPAVRVCTSDALYVRPASRGWVGGRLLVATEQAARARGATLMAWHTRAGSPLTASLLRHGYQPVDVVVVRPL